MFTYLPVTPTGIKSDLLVILFYENQTQNPFTHSDELKSSYSSIVEHVISNKDFKGEFKQSILLYPAKSMNIKRILLIGLGKKDKIDSEKLRETGYLIGKKRKELNAGKVHIMPGSQIEKYESHVLPVAEGIRYSGYKFTQFKTKDKNKETKASYVFLGIKPESVKAFNLNFKQLEAVQEGVAMARNLGNLPANHLTPLKLKNFILNELKNSQSVAIEILDKKNLQKQKFGLLLSVAQGSRQDPYLIILHYKPAKKQSKKVVVVGKGVTFDSGGISIKPSASMDEMKFDMSGAAAAIGIIKSAVILKPETEIISVIPAVENMPGGNAIKPGDIIKAYNGTTVEILNTDAEGRLILADALAYAVKKYKPDLLVDFATLTGSIVAALGDKMAGLFSNNYDISRIFSEAGEESGDRVWPMPLLDAYSKELESKYADLVNIGGRWGGAITAAKFLENFVKKTNWVHVDMAGTANDIKHIDYLPEGATGYGVRLFYKFLALYASM